MTVDRLVKSKRNRNMTKAQQIMMDMLLYGETWLDDRGFGKFYRDAYGQARYWFNIDTAARLPVPPVDQSKVRWPRGWWKGWTPSDPNAYLDEFHNWTIPTPEQKDATHQSALDIADVIRKWWDNNRSQ